MSLYIIRPQIDGDSKWSGRRGSNPRHLAWEANTLPAELRPHSIRECLLFIARPSKDQAPFRIERMCSGTTLLRIYGASLCVIWLRAHESLVDDPASPDAQDFTLTY